MARIQREWVDTGTTVATWWQVPKSKNEWGRPVCCCGVGSFSIREEIFRWRRVFYWCFFLTFGATANLVKMLAVPKSLQQWKKGVFFTANNNITATTHKTNRDADIHHYRPRVHAHTLVQGLLVPSIISLCILYREGTCIGPDPTVQYSTVLVSTVCSV